MSIDWATVAATAASSGLVSAGVTWAVATRGWQHERERETRARQERSILAVESLITQAEQLQTRRLKVVLEHLPDADLRDYYERTMGLRSAVTAARTAVAVEGFSGIEEALDAFIRSIPGLGLEALDAQRAEVSDRLGVLRAAVVAQRKDLL